MLKASGFGQRHPPANAHKVRSKGDFVHESAQDRPARSARATTCATRRSLGRTHLHTRACAQVRHCGCTSGCRMDSSGGACRRRRGTGAGDDAPHRQWPVRDGAPKAALAASVDGKAIEESGTSSASQVLLTTPLRRVRRIPRRRACSLAHAVVMTDLRASVAA